MSAKLNGSKYFRASLTIQLKISHLFIQLNFKTCPVGWGCRIHRPLLCRGVRPRNECPRYDTKQSDGEVQVMLKL